MTSRLWLPPPFCHPWLRHRTASGAYKRRTPPWSALPFSFSSTRFTAIAPSCAPSLSTIDSPLQPLSDRLNPTPSIVPPSTSSPTARTPQVTPTPACRRPSPATDPLRYGWAIQWAPAPSPPPPCRLAPRPLHRRPQAISVDGEKSSPVFGQEPKKPYGPSHFAGPGPVPLWTQAHCNNAILYFFLSNYSNSILIKVQTS
jgi:hypothetical protein